MQIPTALFSSVQQALQNAGAKSISADGTLISLIESLPIQMPQRGRLNTLLRELAKGEVTFQRAQQILGLKKYPPGTDWYFGKDGLLAVIDTWASVLPKPEAPAGETLDLGSVTTLSDAPALRTASVPAQMLFLMQGHRLK